MSNFEGFQHVNWLFMSNLCRMSGESIQFVYNIHEGKGGKGGTESLRELTAGAEKHQIWGYADTVAKQLLRVQCIWRFNVISLLFTAGWTTSRNLSVSIYQSLPWSSCLHMQAQHPPPPQAQPSEIKVAKTQTLSHTLIFYLTPETLNRPTFTPGRHCVTAGHVTCVIWPGCWDEAGVKWYLHKVPSPEWFMAQPP